MSRAPLVIRDGGLFTPLTCLVATIIGGMGMLGPKLRSNAIEAAWGQQAGILWYLLMLAAGTYGLYIVAGRRELTPPPPPPPPFPPVAAGPSRSRTRQLVTRVRSRVTRAANRAWRVADRVIVPQSLRRTLALERISMFGIGWALLAYPPAAAATNGSPGFTASLPFLALSVFTAVRVRQIHVDLRKLNAVPADQPPADPPIVSDPDGAAA